MTVWLLVSPLCVSESDGEDGGHALLDDDGAASVAPSTVVSGIRGGSAHGPGTVTTMLDDDSDDSDFTAHIFDNLGDGSDSDELIPDETLEAKLNRYAGSDRHLPKRWSDS